MGGIEVGWLVSYFGLTQGVKIGLSKSIGCLFSFNLPLAG